MKYRSTIPNIKSWAEEDRPREKFYAKGPSALSTAELIAIILGSGSQNASAVELAKCILANAQNNLSQLSKISISELLKFKGIGIAKAVTLCAAFELGKRVDMTNPETKPIIKSSLDAYKCLHGVMKHLKYEEFKVLYLNRQNKLIKIHQISSGGVTGTTVDPKLIFKVALDLLSCNLILCHNHPSGNLKPSASDIQLTQKIKSAGEFLDITVLDHLIISSEGYFSFADEGLL